MKINSEIARQIKEQNSPEYILWANGSEITESELVEQFNISLVEGEVVLHHVTEDFYIMNICFEDIEILEELSR